VAEAGLEHPFLEHAWARTWWECFGSGSRLHILLVTAGKRSHRDRSLDPDRNPYVGSAAAAAWIPVQLPCARADFIIGTQNHRHASEEAYAAIWRHISRNRCWDLLQLCQLPEGSATLEAIPRLASKDGHPLGVWQSGASPFVPLESSWPSYCEGLATKHRSNLRNRFKRLERSGAVELETIAFRRYTFRRCRGRTTTGGRRVEEGSGDGHYVRSECRQVLFHVCGARVGTRLASSALSSLRSQTGGLRLFTALSETR